MLIGDLNDYSFVFYIFFSFQRILPLNFFNENLFRLKFFQKGTKLFSFKFPISSLELFGIKFNSIYIEITSTIQNLSCNFKWSKNRLALSVIYKISNLIIVQFEPFRIHDKDRSSVPLRQQNDESKVETYLLNMIECYIRE